MGIPLSSKTRVLPPDSDYPYGRTKDTLPGDPGTPANTETHGDFHQFFAKMADIAGIVLNGLYDSAYSGFQYFQALLGIGFKYHTDPIVMGLLGGLYTTGDVIIFSGVVITLTNSNNTATWTSGYIFHKPDSTKPGKTYLVAAGTLTKTGGQVFVYSISDSEDCLITIGKGSTGSGIADYGSATVKRYGSWTTTDFNSAFGIANSGSFYKYRIEGKTCFLNFILGSSHILNSTAVYFNIPVSLTPKITANNFQPDNFSIGRVAYDDDSQQPFYTDVQINSPTDIRVVCSAKINGWGTTFDTSIKGSLFIGQIMFEIDN